MTASSTFSPEDLNRLGWNEVIIKPQHMRSRKEKKFCSQCGGKLNSYNFNHKHHCHYYEMQERLDYYIEQERAKLGTQFADIEFEFLGYQRSPIG